MTEKMVLTEEDKQGLLVLARSVIAREFRPNTKLPDSSIFSDTVFRKAGVFVTLKIRGCLRGCIGEILPTRPLIEAVEGRALDAAFGDPRFYPLTEKEFPETDLEISVLTPPCPGTIDEIVLGTHGILLSKGRRSAVFLPQVAVEEHWDLETTLTQLSLKAGMGPDSWREGANYQLFEAIVFGEREEKNVQR